MTPASSNFALSLQRWSTEAPERPALIRQDPLEPSRFEQRTYLQLASASARYARALVELGFQPGDRVGLLVPPSFETIALFFAAARTGIVPVVVDPGMGPEAMVKCLSQSGLAGIIGIRRAHLLRVLHRKALAKIRRWATVGKSIPFTPNLDRLASRHSSDWMSPFDPGAEDLALVGFTSGSTGTPKGVVFRHSMILAAGEALRAHFGLMPGGVDFGTFTASPLWAVLLGMTGVIPAMDFVKPAKSAPGRMVQALEQTQATSALGSPTMWRLIVGECEARARRLDHLRTVMISGGSVSPDLVRRLVAVLPHATIRAFYGSSELYPGVTSIDASELLSTEAQTSAGEGACLGTVWPGMGLKILPLTDEPLHSVSGALPAGEIGEIAVQGAIVSPAYLEHPEANAASKIHDKGEVWHRTGDVGYLDTHQRLWFCGRKGHRVITASGTLYTEQCEPIFNGHPAVARSALVGAGASPTKPVMVVQLHPEAQPRDPTLLRAELLERGARVTKTSGIHEVLFHPELPTDARHNAKILRDRLVPWVNEQLHAKQ
jgi:olefin beta-lactone synthetase